MRHYMRKVTHTRWIDLSDLYKWFSGFSWALAIIKFALVLYCFRDRYFEFNSFIVIVHTRYFNFVFFFFVFCWIWLFFNRSTIFCAFVFLDKSFLSFSYMTMNHGFWLISMCSRTQSCVWFFCFFFTAFSYIQFDRCLFQ